MSYFRAIVSGIVVWLLVITTFAGLTLISGVQDSPLQQYIVVGVLIIFYAMLGAFLYYRTGRTSHGLKVGGIMSMTALALDVLITVPLLEIPNGGSYFSFFTSPVLWILVAINVATLYVYYKRWVV